MLKLFKTQNNIGNLMSRKLEVLYGQKSIDAQIHKLKMKYYTYSF